MPNLNDLIQETAYLLGDSGGNRWLQAIANPPVLGTNDIQYLLIRAAEWFNLLTGVYHSTIDLPVQAGIATVALRDSSGAPPYGPLLRLEDENGKALIERKAAWLNTTEGQHWRQSEGDAKDFIRGLDSFGTVRLFPAPKVSKVYKAFITAKPVPMLRAGDLPWIGGGANIEASPEQYHAALPFHAAWQALVWNRVGRDLEMAKMFRAEFDMRAQMAAAEVKATLGGSE